MPAIVPTPPESERIRQVTVHKLRTERVKLSRKLVSSDYRDNKAASQLVEVNSKIDVLQTLLDPTGTLDEPSIAEIEGRGLDWYWENWVIDTDDDDYTP